MIINKYIITFFAVIHLFGNSQSQSIEFNIKASFIEKFARLTEWQEPINGEYFVIKVLGSSPFHGELEKTFKTLKIKNKTVKIIYVKSISEIGNCQILFICESEKSQLADILKNIDPQNTLTISDTPTFCKKGVYVNFYIDDLQTVKYEINITQIQKTKMVLNIQLLNFARRIK